MTDPDPNYSTENNARPPPDRNANVIDSTFLKSLSDEEKEKILRNIGYLSGVRVDITDGPIRLNRLVARHRLGELPCVREVNDIISEVITSKNEREASLVHQGWSLNAASTTTPWIASRIARHNQRNQDGVWVTKRTIVQRLAFSIPLEELLPEQGFTSDIESALEKPTVYEKFQAVYRAFDIWGDLVPLEFDVGLSLAFTDTETNLARLPRGGTHRCVGDLLAIKTACIFQQGGDVTNDDWINPKRLAATVSPLQWCQVRIISVIPTIDLLEDRLKKRLSELYSQRLSYFPLLIMGPTKMCKMVDDHENTNKTISSIIIRVRWLFDSIRFKYLDGTESKRHGNQREVEDEYRFVLGTDEYITEIMAWSGGSSVYGLQFVTSIGRVSPHYGGPLGTPAIVRSRGGVLVGLTTRFCYYDVHSEHLLSEFEGIWRHDLLKILPKESDVFSSYFGGVGGTPFNDRTLVRNSSTMHISRVDVGCSNVIDSIQFTYVYNEGGRPIESQTSRHGGPGGTRKSFVLEPGERIVTISGKHNNEVITQLCFATSLGRTSDIFSGGQGSDFSVSAPQDSNGARMCLHYICGKGDEHLNGIMFVWTP